MVAVKQKNPESLAAIRRDYKARYNLSNRPDAYEVADIAQLYGIKFGLDPHSLSFDQKTVLHDLARLVGYKKSGGSSLSLGSAFYQYLGKKLNKKNPKLTRRHFVDAFDGMTEASVRAYNDVVKGITESAFYKKHHVGDYGQYKETAEKYAGRLFRLPKANKKNPNTATRTGKKSTATFDFIANGSFKNPYGFTKYVTRQGKRYILKSINNDIGVTSYQLSELHDKGIRAVIYTRGDKHAIYAEVATKKNATAADFKQHQKSRLQDLAAMFQGKANGEKRRVLESDYAPKDKYRLGYLVQIKIKDGGKTIPIDFDGESYLAGDLRNNLWVVGKDAKITNIKLPPKGQLKYLGELIQVDYVTAKKHIEGGKTVRFYHKLGEVTKETPNLFIDDEGFPIIVSGGYDVWDVGIVN